MKFFVIIILFFISGCSLSKPKEYTVIREKTRGTVSGQEALRGQNNMNSGQYPMQMVVMQPNGQNVVYYVVPAPMNEIQNQGNPQSQQIGQNYQNIYPQNTTIVSANSGLVDGTSVVSTEVIPSVITGQGMPYPQKEYLQNPNSMPLVNPSPNQQIQQMNPIQDTITSTGKQINPMGETNVVNKMPIYVSGNTDRPVITDDALVSCPYIVVLQHPVRRDIVKCVLCDKMCIATYEKNGYAQLRYTPQFSGPAEVPSLSDYPSRKWRDNNEIPRW